MNSYNPSLEAQQRPEELTPTESSQPGASESMREYYQLQKTLFLVILVLAGIVFVSVWFFYSLNTALNYLLGACVGGLYLRRLAKDIEGLGRNQKRLGLGRLGLFIALMITATQIKNLHILPIFLGFLTYKAAIIVYVVQTSLLPVQK